MDRELKRKIKDLALQNAALTQQVARLEADKSDSVQVCPPPPPPPPPRGALEGKGPQRRPQQRLGRRLEEVAEAVGGSYCRLQMPLRLALGVRGIVPGRWLGALEGGGGGALPLPMHPCPPMSHHRTYPCVSATSEAAPGAVRQAVGGGCRSGWGRLLSVTNAVEVGAWRQGNSGWA